MSGKSKEDYKQDYTDPVLREKLKEEIKQSSKGGDPNKWSARKSQILKKEYESQGGDYIHKGTLSSPQKNLRHWSKKN